MRLTRLTVKFAASALGVAMCAAVLALPASAQSQSQASDDVPFDTKLIRGILEGIGLKRDGEDGINYQERSPLVLPPSHDLPPPQTTDGAVNNPAWPKDPDVARRKAAAAAERNRNVSEEREREENRLSPDELAPGAKGNPKLARTGGRADTGPSPTEDDHYRMSPSELGYKGGLFGNMFGGKKDDENVAKFTREPPRASLTDPPPGYRTPSPDQPYGVAKDTSAPKATNYLATHGELESGR
jgi:hypothetical protein